MATTSRVRARIQGHPAREELQRELLRTLAPLEPELLLHSSDPPNPWEGYKLCLTDPPDCTHLLVIQDDAQPVRNFTGALQQIAERWPTTPVVLFLAANPSSAAARARQVLKHGGRRYIPLGASPFVPLVAVLWPLRKTQEFLAWSESAESYMTRADDGNAGRWVRQTKQEFMVAVPSIVEHNDHVDSVKGGRKATWGADRGRVAALLAEDALQYEW